MIVVRPSLDRILMASAYLWACRSTCPTLQVGAVLAKGGREFAQGYNGAARGLLHCDHEPGDHDHALGLVHAEKNALLSAGVTRSGTMGATLYTTHSPCVDCAGAIINAGIAEVVYDETFRDRSGLDLLARAALIVRRIE